MLRKLCDLVEFDVVPNDSKKICSTLSKLTFNNLHSDKLVDNPANHNSIEIITMSDVIISAILSIKLRYGI